DAIVLLSDTMWRRYFNADPDILGRTLTFHTVLGPRRQNSYMVVGVMPPSFAFPDSDTLFWMPYAVTAQGGGPAPRGALVARLADGVSIDAATEELGSILVDLRRYSTRVTYDMRRPKDQLTAS